jgi:NAD(P)-dependent dehydrogenase (short-subunit alcohol dehydrogenase family)
MSALTGGTAVITGAGSGLGAAMAAAFAAEGMRIAALDINREAAESTATGLTADGTDALGLAVDVADRSTLEAAATTVADRFATCNVLCANVGVQQFGALEMLTSDDWQWILSVNVIGTANTVNAFLPLLRASDGPRHIVLTSSVAALMPSPRQGAYIASKFAVTGYGDVLRQELADDDIGVTLMFPAGMITNHIESSRAARPDAFGVSALRDEDLEVVIATAGSGDDMITTPEDAISDLVRDMLAGEPYVITHGAQGAEIHARHEALEGAYGRMRKSRDGRTPA